MSSMMVHCFKQCVIKIILSLILSPASRSTGPPGRVVIRLSQKANFPMKKVRFGRFEKNKSLPAVIFG
jgi:hypothetical protein